MSHRTSTQRRTWKERALSLLLTTALVVGLIPGLTLSASAEHWADAYLDQLVDWGVMRADQTAEPDADLTRAEFFAIINRAYGYTETGGIPFEDVLPTDWFYDDISIAYTAGYMAGTSETTASPNDSLTREQAFCILGRNMMLKDGVGESLAFADSRDVSDWARGTIKAAADNYIVSGYPDNTLHPQDSISKAQMAVLISQCLGNPIRESGTYDLGGVFGNVTITAPNVTLRNATISGDLYISGGVGLGGIKLENVDVLGRIIVSSAGESEGGNASVIMRNVTADEMLVDNMRNKTVTIRADGITDIARTIVRTNAYLEDNNTDDKGLMYIEVDGDPGLRLTLAGRIKEVVNKTPSAYIQAAKGTVAKLTVDEAATNSTVQIDRNTKINEVNLDVATNVLGDGDIGQLNINAPGSIVSMLPDKIYIRPGLTASIAGVIMDYQAAEEGSLDPRLLSGYPAAKDIAPTGFRADFAGNKKGTIYWAVSYLSDGSIGEEDLISPPSYGSKAIANGSVAEPTGGEEVSAQVGNLVVGGSYYLSAILVDEQKERSPVKVISFSTPDNTVPAFAQGYPYMSRTTRSVAQVTVMPTKSCKLYYALLPQGAQAPTPNELKAAAVLGNLGYGVRDVTKNTEEVFTVNSQRLEELKSYVLYLWLTDVDGVNSSTVQSLAFTIPDETPPEFVVHPYMNGNPQATAIPMAATVNENATIFWAVVEAGTPYPLPNTNSTNPEDNVYDPETGRVVASSLFSDYAKLCVTSGMGALARGQVVARANTEVTFNLTGLLAEKAYDLYYLARDTAGNYTVQVYKLDGGVHTLDNSGPVVTQSFSWVPSQEEPNSPMSSTDITLDFSENIRSASNIDKDFLTLYNERNDGDPYMDAFVNTLKKSIILYHVTPESETPVLSKQDDPDGNWVIDYSKVVIRATEEGHITITFPGTRLDPDNAAVRLANGEQYYFELWDITDTATPKANPLHPSGANPVSHKNTAGTAHSIPPFTTVFSQVLMGSYGLSAQPFWRGATESGKLPSELGVANPHAKVDVNFRLNPQSTADVNANQLYDILIYAQNDFVSFDLYYRIIEKSTELPVESGGKVTETYKDNLITDYNAGTDPKRNTPDENGWRYLGNQSVANKNGLSVGTNFTGSAGTPAGFPKLQNLSEKLYYEFAISVTKKGILTERPDWKDEVYFDIFVEAGGNTALTYLGEDPGKRVQCENAGRNNTYGVTNIGYNAQDGAKYLHLPAPFPNTRAPSFQSNTPLFKQEKNTQVDPKTIIEDGNRITIVGDTFAFPYVNLTTFGKVHYVVVERDSLPPELAVKNADGTVIRTITDSKEVWDAVPTDGRDADKLKTPFTVTNIEPLQIADHETYFKSSPRGTFIYDSSGTNPIEPHVTKLTSSTNEKPQDYYIYFVLEANKESADEGTWGAFSPVYVYKFRTSKTMQPRLSLDDNRRGIVTISTAPGSSNQINVSANLQWIVFSRGAGKDLLSRTFTVPNSDGKYAITGYQDIHTYLDALIDSADRKYDAKTAYGVATDADVPDDAKYGTEFNGLSIFDVFADDNGNAKQYVYGLLSSSGGDVVKKVLTGAQTDNNYSYEADWVTDGDKVQPYPNEYLMLAVAQNTGALAEEWYTVSSFAVCDPVILQDREPPQLNEWGEEHNPNGIGSQYGSISITNVSASYKGELSGQINLSFDKDLYWRQGGVDYRVIGGSSAPPPGATGDNEPVGILYGTNISGTLATVPGSEGPRNYVIRFSGITDDTTPFQILPNGYFAAQKGEATTEELWITINKGKTQKAEESEDGSITYKDVYVPFITVSFIGNDGRQKGGTVHGNEVPADDDTTAPATAPSLTAVSRVDSVGIERDGSGVDSENRPYIKASFKLTFNSQLFKLVNGTGSPVAVTNSNFLSDSAKGGNSSGFSASVTKDPSSDREWTMTISNAMHGSNLTVFETDKITANSDNSTRSGPLRIEVSVTKTRSDEEYDYYTPEIRVYWSGSYKDSVTGADIAVRKLNTNMESANVTLPSNLNIGYTVKVDLNFNQPLYTDASGSSAVKDLVAAAGIPTSVQGASIRTVSVSGSRYTLEISGIKKTDSPIVFTSSKPLYGKSGTRTTEQIKITVSQTGTAAGQFANSSNITSGVQNLTAKVQFGNKDKASADYLKTKK